MTREVRYYGQVYDADMFRGGWRGLWIRFLARVQAWLARRIEWHVMHFIARRHGVPAGALRESFKLEETRARARTVVGELLGAEKQPLQSERYKFRKGSADGQKSYREQRVDRTRQFIASYQDAGRAGRYRYNRGQRMADPDGDVVERPGGE